MLLTWGIQSPLCLRTSFPECTCSTESTSGQAYACNCVHDNVTVCTPAKTATFHSSNVSLPNKLTVHHNRKPKAMLLSPSSIASCQNGCRHVCMLESFIAWQPNMSRLQPSQSWQSVSVSVCTKGHLLLPVSACFENGPHFHALRCTHCSPFAV